MFCCGLFGRSCPILFLCRAYPNPARGERVRLCCPCRDSVTGLSQIMTITRRDFLNGMALGIAAGLTPLQQIAAATRAALGTYIPGDDYYPPGLTGLRGSHDGSFEVAHLPGREGAVSNCPKQPKKSTTW